MSLFKSKKNPNTKEFWEKRYEDLIDNEELRSDGPALNMQHVHKFTVNRMFYILSTYSEIVHIASRTLSKRTGKTTTAYFYIQKPIY